MDPFKFLGVAEKSARTKEGFEKLRASVKEQHKRYSQSGRQADAKKVQEAYESVKKKLGLDEASLKQREKEKAQKAAEEAAQPVGPIEPAGPEVSSDAPQPPPEAADNKGKKRKGEAMAEEKAKRQEMIAQKLAEKRKQPKAEDPEALRRQEAIRERLAKKRAGNNGEVAPADASTAAAQGQTAPSAAERASEATEAAGKSSTAEGISDATEAAGDDPVSRRLKRLQESTSDQTADDPVTRRMKRLQESEKARADEAAPQPDAKEKSPAVLTVDISEPDKKKLQFPSRPTTGIGSRSVRASTKSGRGHFLVCSRCNESISREFFKFCREKEEGFTCHSAECGQ
jgi:hypothetical protein